MDLSDAENRRAALETERKSLRHEADQAQTLAQTLKREKSILENSRNVLRGESRELEARRASLKELQEVGKRELEGGRGELKIAAEGVEKGKELVKEDRKVSDWRIDLMGWLRFWSVN